MSFWRGRRALGIKSKRVGCSPEQLLISDVSDSRNLRQSGGGAASGSGSSSRRALGGAEVVGKSRNSEVARQILWSYLAGLLTGLALFGAGSFYFNRIFG